MSERNELVATLAGQLAEDPRFVAAWLHGSIGRGLEDAWSDIDVWVVVRDEEFESVVSARYDQVGRLGQLVHTEESPMNGGPGGVYLMAGYDAPSGMHLVDWYWQPQSLARKPDDVLPLFAKQEVQGGAKPDVAPFVAWRPTPEQDAVNCSALAWAMIAIQAKHIARRRDEAGLRFQAFIEQLMTNASRGASVFAYGDGSSLSSPTAKLDRLVKMAADLRYAYPDWSPQADSVSRFLATVQAAVLA